MSFDLPLILIICFAFSRGQSPVPATQRPRHDSSPNLIPPNCTTLLGQGTTDPYDNTSLAAVYQAHFCSVRTQLSQCISDNQQAMISGDNAYQWALGITFNKNAFDVDIQDLCNRLPNVAAELECFKTAGDALTCASSLQNVIPPTFDQFRQGLITMDAGQKAVCGAIQNMTNCEVSRHRNCSKSSKQFIMDYSKVLFGNCESGSILEALPPYIRDSIFVTCTIDSFTNIIEDLIREVATVNISDIDSLMPTITAFMSHLCMRTEEFSRCIAQRARNTTNQIDFIILQFVNASNLKSALDILCQSGNDVSVASRCFSDIPAQGKFCATFYQFTNSYGTTPVPRVFTEAPRVFTALPTISPADIERYLRTYCPRMKDVVDCTYLPLSRCSRQLTATMNRVVSVLMTDRCGTLADEGMPSVDLVPTASVFLKCGNVINTQIFKEIGNPQCRSAICDDITTIIRKGMDIACRNAEWFMSCVDERLPASNNVIDRFFSHILDFSSGVNRTQVISSVCGKIEDVKSQLNCVISRVTQANNSFLACAQENFGVWSLLGNLTEIAKMNGLMVRSRFCTPIQKMLSCARSSVGSCGTTLDSLMESLPKAVLRTDCGGIRLSTTPVSTTFASSQTTRNLGVLVKQDILTVGLTVITLKMFVKN